MSHSTTLKNNQDLQYALDSTPFEDALVLHAKSSVPAAELRRFLDAAPLPQAPPPDPVPVVVVPQKQEEEHPPVIVAVPESARETEDRLVDGPSDELTDELTDDFSVIEASPSPQQAPPDSPPVAAAVPSDKKQEQNAAPEPVNPPKQAQPMDVPAEPQAPQPSVDLVSVMRMMLADPQLNALIEEMVDHVLNGPRQNNPLGQALDAAAGIVEAQSVPAPAPAAAVHAAPAPAAPAPAPVPVSAPASIPPVEKHVESSPVHRREKTCAELADEISKVDLTSFITTKPEPESDDKRASSHDEDSDLSDSLIGSFAEIRDSSDSPQSAEERESVVHEPDINRVSATAQEEKPQPRAPVADSELDSEFVRVDDHVPVQEREEMFQRPSPSKSGLSTFWGLFGRTSNSQSSSEIHVNESVKELQKKLVSMGFHVTTPQAAHYLSRFRTQEAVVKYLTETAQRRPAPQTMYPYGAH